MPSGVTRAAMTQTCHVRPRQRHLPWSCEPGAEAGSAGNGTPPRRMGSARARMVARELTPRGLSRPLSITSRMRGEPRVRDVEKRVVEHFSGVVTAERAAVTDWRRRGPAAKPKDAPERT